MKMLKVEMNPEKDTLSIEFEGPQPQVMDELLALAKVIFTEQEINGKGIGEKHDFKKGK